MPPTGKMKMPPKQASKQSSNRNKSKEPSKNQLINSLQVLAENVMSTKQGENSMKREHQTTERATL